VKDSWKNLSDEEQRQRLAEIISSKFDRPASTNIAALVVIAPAAAAKHGVRRERCRRVAASSRYKPPVTLKESGLFTGVSAWAGQGSNLRPWD
jgi:hypothetical protein